MRSACAVRVIVPVPNTTTWLTVHPQWILRNALGGSIAAPARVASPHLDARLSPTWRESCHRAKDPLTRRRVTKKGRQLGGQDALPPINARPAHDAVTWLRAASDADRHDHDVPWDRALDVVTRRGRRSSGAATRGARIDTCHPVGVNAQSPPALGDLFAHRPPIGRSIPCSPTTPTPPPSHHPPPHARDVRQQHGDHPVPDAPGLRHRHLAPAADGSGQRVMLFWHRTSSRSPRLRRSDHQCSGMTRWGRLRRAGGRTTDHR